MFENVKVGDLVLAKIGTENVHIGIVVEVPDHEVFIVDRIQKGILVEFYVTPDTLYGAKRPRPLGSTMTFWTREADLQAVA